MQIAFAIYSSSAPGKASQGRCVSIIEAKLAHVKDAAKRVGVAVRVYENEMAISERFISLSVWVLSS